MATVDGLTKARMLAIEAGSIVSGTIDAAGHLILTRKDGSLVDAGYIESDRLFQIVDTASVDLVLAGAGTVASPWVLSANTKLSLTKTDTPSIDITITGVGTTANPWAVSAKLAREGTTAQRDTKYGVPATDAARVALANQKVRWFNNDLGWEESYYAVTGLTGLTAKGLLAGTASGWYPMGEGPEIVLEPTATFAAAAGGNIGGWNGSVRRNGGAAWFGHGGSGIDFMQPGYYDFSWWTLQINGTGQADYHTLLRNAADTTTDWMSNVHGTTLTSIYTRTGAEYQSQPVRAGQQLKVAVIFGSLDVHNVTGGTTYPSSRGEMRAKYIRPLLVSD